MTTTMVKGITYTYEIEMSINDGEALITVDATNGETEASAMFVIDVDGEITLDTQSDCCEDNPFDEDSDWPEPSAEMIAEAIELAKGTI